MASSSIQSDIQKSVWGGTVPLVISLASDDLTDFVIPRPLHLTVPRMIMWSSVITLVHAHFSRQTAQLDLVYHPYDCKFLLNSSPILESCANELDLCEIKTPVWLEGPGKTAIDWRVPVGVCVDLWTSTAVNQQYLDHSANIPIKIIAHFTKQPESLPDCHIVACRGWSLGHRQRKDDDDHNSSSSNLGSSSGSLGSSSSKLHSKDNNLVAAHAMNTTKRALIEHNTRALLPLFLQLPSSTHIRAALSHLRMSSAILHKSATHIMGLPTPIQSQFVSCLFSNSCTELSTVIPMCDCSQCTTFLTTFSGYDLHPGSMSVPSKAAKVVKARVQKVISALKRDSSDSSDEEERREEEQNKKNEAITNMVTAGNDSLANSKMMMHKGEMNKEQREQYSILTSPAMMLLCQVTRLVFLTRSLCGTLSSFEKALGRLELDVKDAWRRRAGRFEQDIGHNNNTELITTTRDFFNDEPSTPLSPTSENHTPLFTNGLPPLWEPHYNYLPIKLYTTQHIAVICTSKAEMGHTTPVTLPKASDATPSLQTKWAKYRLISKLESSSCLQSTPSTPLHSTNPETPSNNELLAQTPSTPLASSSQQQHSGHLMTGSIQCPYLENLTVEQFLLQICPQWRYRYGKNPALLKKESIQQHSNYPEDDETSSINNLSDSDTSSLSSSSLNNGQAQRANNDSNDYLVAVCHGVVIPYDTPIIWLYHHMLHADLTLHLTLALEEDVDIPVV